VDEDLDRHARVHALQSMHVDASRTTRWGGPADQPSSAPYGQRYRHQKFFTTTESRTRTARVTAVTPVISVKNRSIFASREVVRPALERRRSPSRPYEATA